MLKQKTKIYNRFLESKQLFDDRVAAVNSLRHLVMDKEDVNTEDNADYLLVYERVMSDIASQYPLLSSEVERQVAKKKRRQERRSLEEHKNSLHI